MDRTISADALERMLASGDFQSTDCASTVRGSPTAAAGDPLPLTEAKEEGGNMYADVLRATQTQAQAQAQAQADGESRAKPCSVSPRELRMAASRA